MISQLYMTLLYTYILYVSFYLQLIAQEISSNLRKKYN